MGEWQVPGWELRRQLHLSFLCEIRSFVWDSDYERIVRNLLGRRILTIQRKLFSKQLRLGDGRAGATTLLTLPKYQAELDVVVVIVVVAIAEASVRNPEKPCST